jgi:hypothetical protein
MEANLFDSALHFTKIYQQHQEDPVPLREIACLNALIDTYFTHIQEGDLFAGRVYYAPLGFGLETTSGGSLLRQSCN